MKNPLDIPLPDPLRRDQVGLDAEKVRNGLARLVLTVIEVVRDVMEKQAIRRIEAGSLTDTQIEELGKTFKALKQELTKLQTHFSLEKDDLEIGLGELGGLPELASSGGESSLTLTELLDRVFAKGITARGDIVLSVADVELVVINLALLISGVETALDLYRTDPKKELDAQITLLEQRLETLKRERKKRETVST
jgi:hypothetical protein